jgi:hypothetical protein
VRAWHNRSGLILRLVLKLARRDITRRPRRPACVRFVLPGRTPMFKLKSAVTAARLGALFVLRVKRQLLLQPCTLLEKLDISSKSPTSVVRLVLQAVTRRRGLLSAKGVPQEVTSLGAMRRAACPAPLVLGCIRQ